MRKVAIFIFCIILFASCSQSNSGIVTHKKFEPEYSQTYVTFISNGNTSIPVFQTRTVPDRWNITIEMEIEGKTKTKKVYVSEDFYDSISIGDFFQGEGAER